MTPAQYTSLGFLVAKVLTIIALILYVVYAGIMVRQEQLMTKVFAETSETILRLLVIIHLLASLFVVVLALILL